MDYSIRKATNDDCEAVVDLVRSCLAEFGRTLDEDDYDKELFDIENGYAGGAFLVAVSNERIVGTAGLAYVEPGVAMLNKMYIHPDCRGMGIGRNLLNGILAAAEEAGFRKIVLETLREMAAAQSLYESVGFRRSGDVCGNIRCDFLYELNLG